MSDTVFFQTAHQASSVKGVGARVVTFVATTCAVLREWRHNYRSRRELALYSHYERNDLNFSTEVDAEIVKPFWSK